MRIESPIAEGVTINEPILRSARKSDRTTEATESDAVVSTSYTSSVTGELPRRPVLSSGNRRNTESTAVMVSTVAPLFGLNTAGNTSNRRIALVTTVSGRLAIRMYGDRPSAG